MGNKTKINWTDATWNPVSGCTPAGVGCAHCCAKRVAERFPAVHGVEYAGMTEWGESIARAVPFSRVICHPERLGVPERWKNPRAIMCPSMGDLFHEDVPGDFQYEVWKVWLKCEQHTFIVLTKRPERMVGAMKGLLPLTNVVLGASVSTQKEADYSIPLLLSIKPPEDIPVFQQKWAARRIISLEPLVGPVIIQPEHLSRLDGVIVGGESGPGARLMHPDWVRSLRDQCEAAGVPFFFKQWGEWVAGCQTDLCSSLPSNSVLMSAIGDTGRAAVSFSGDGDDCVRLFRVGRSRAGRLLDGRTHDALCWDVRGKGEA